MRQDLKKGTQKFSLDCWRLCSEVPKSREYDAWVRQLIKWSDSVGANYRASQRSKSTADFIHKLDIVEEEIDESMLWLELFLEILQTNHSEISEKEQLNLIYRTSISTSQL